ncbi:MAG: DUF2061 domain-containing protein [Phycisphaerae bacterium]|nr:DUF2061 domain-containing protein [Phycisphaerae bacterium]
MDSHIRSIFKAILYRFWGSSITFLVSWLLTGNFKVAAGIGVLDTVLKIGAFYGHERLWDNIHIGRKKTPQPVIHG